MGRINFGDGMINEKKGIITDIIYDGKVLTNWTAESIPL